MQVLNFSVSNQILTAACPGRLVVAQTRGHLFAQFALDQEWDGLSVTAVFSNDFARQSYQRILTSDPVEVPEEVLVAGRLFVSLVGLGDGGALRLTTKCMDKPIVVYRAGELVGLTLEETTPDLWEQVLASMGSLADLKTSDKSSLVAAINESLQSGGTGSVDPEEIAQAVADYIAAHPIQETDPTVPAWAKQPEKPTYTAEEVHALPDTVNPIVSADGNSQDGHLVVWDTDSSLVRDGGSFQDNLKQNIDSTLSQPGKAADAAAVGEELSSLSGKMVQSVNNQKPDENGNVTVEVGSGGGDIALGITGAAVGQIAKITAVDDTGKPTAWEPVDMEGGWELITYVTLTEDGGGAFSGVITKNDNGEEFEYRQCMVCISGTVIDGWPSGAAQYITLYSNNDASGNKAAVVLTRLSPGAGGSTYKSTIEISLFAGLWRCIACGGQADTSSLIFRGEANIDTFKSITFSCYGNSQWTTVPYAAGGRIVIYGRK